MNGMVRGEKKENTTKIISFKIDNLGIYNFWRSNLVTARMEPFFYILYM